MEYISTQSLCTDVREVLVGPAPMGIHDSRRDSLPYIVVGNRDMFLLEFAVGNLGTLNDAKIVAEQVRRFCNRHSQASKHITNRNSLLHCRSHRDKFCETLRSNERSRSGVGGMKRVAHKR